MESEQQTIFEKVVYALDATILPNQNKATVGIGISRRILTIRSFKGGRVIGYKVGTRFGRLKPPEETFLSCPLMENKGMLVYDSALYLSIPEGKTVIFNNDDSPQPKGSREIIMGQSEKLLSLGCLRCWLHRICNPRAISLPRNSIYELRLDNRISTRNRGGIEVDIKHTAQLFTPKEP